MDQPGKITKDTLVPIGLVLTLLAGVAYIAGLHSKVEAQGNEILALQIERREYQRTVEEINTRLARIEGKLGVTR